MLIQIKIVPKDVFLNIQTKYFSRPLPDFKRVKRQSYFSLYFIQLGSSSQPVLFILGTFLFRFQLSLSFFVTTTNRLAVTVARLLANLVMYKKSQRLARFRIS